MSYLLENSEVITKSQFLDEEDKYLLYEHYPLDDHVLITENKKPFFSIYDIANYCKKKYKDSKLFLIAHRFYDRVAGEKITEFYMLNSVNIFDKSLTSCLVIKSNELIDKQHVIQDNLHIAMKMLNTNNIHIILGDNVKEHEVSEFLNSTKEKSSLEIFDSDVKYESKDVEYEDIKIKSTRISSILKSIRILEPKKNKVQKNIFLLILIILSFYISDEYMNSLFQDEIRKEKREKRGLDDQLRKYNKDLTFKEGIYSKNLKAIQDLSKKEVYTPKSK